MGCSCGMHVLRLMLADSSTCVVSKEPLRPLLSGRQGISSKKQRQKDISQSNFPPQLWARCNYCSTSLPLSKLRRQEGIANSWLSRQKPILTCCPQCKKPLPRCSICLLSLGCLKKYPGIVNQSKCSIYIYKSTNLAGTQKSKNVNL